jgi:hypothetical protein
MKKSGEDSMKCDEVVKLFSSDNILNIDLSIGNLFEFKPTEDIIDLNIFNWGSYISNWVSYIDKQVLTLMLEQPEPPYDIDWGDILWANATTPQIKDTSIRYVIMIYSEDKGITKYAYIVNIVKED